MFRQFEGTNYLFAVSMRDQKTTADFKLPWRRHAEVNVLSESRTLAAGPEFRDAFDGYSVHLYGLEIGRAVARRLTSLSLSGSLPSCNTS